MIRTIAQSVEYGSFTYLVFCDGPLFGQSIKVSISVCAQMILIWVDAITTYLRTGLIFFCLSFGEFELGAALRHVACGILLCYFSIITVSHCLSCWLKFLCKYRISFVKKFCFILSLDFDCASFTPTPQININQSNRHTQHIVCNLK